MGKAGFQKGNKAGLGNRGRSANKDLTQALISQLHEMKNYDKEVPLLDRRGRPLVDAKGRPVTTSSRKRMMRLHKIVDKLIENAEEGDNQATIFIFDRVEGRVKQTLGFSEEEEKRKKITVVIEEADDRV